MDHHARGGPRRARVPRGTDPGLGGRCQSYNLARVRALQGRTGEAIAYIQRSVDTRWGNWDPSAPDPLLATIEDDPRYQAILAELRNRLDRQRERALREAR